MGDPVTTRRLIGERPGPDHLDGLARIMGDQRVADTMWPEGFAGTPGPRTREQVADWIERDREHWDAYGFGCWAVRERDGARVVGRIGVQHTLSTGCDEVEVGWVVDPEHWGRGLATEMAATAIEWGFALGAPSIVAFTWTSNSRSLRVIEKLGGFTFERDFEHAGLPHVLYRRRAA